MLKLECKNILSHHQFFEMINGKTVAVVGSSSSVEGRSQKELIESHDLVVRFNYMLPIPQSLIPDIGSRTDILYNVFSNVTEAEKESLLKLYDWENVKDIKCIVSATNPKASRMKLREHFLKHHGYKIPSYLIDIKFVKELRRKYFISAPTTGVIAVANILANKPSQMYVTGFTAHHDKYYNGYNNNQYDNFWENGIPKVIWSHNLAQQAICLRRLWKENNNIFKPDHILEEILSTRLTHYHE